VPSVSEPITYGCKDNISISCRIPSDPNPQIKSTDIHYLYKSSSAFLWIRSLMPLQYHFAKKHGDKNRKGFADNKGDTVSQFKSDAEKANRDTCYFWVLKTD